MCGRICLFTVCLLVLPLEIGCADSIEFDLPPVVAAQSDEQDPTRVIVSLRLSSLIASPDMADIDQWLVTCRPRSYATPIVDYFPRTETQSDITSPIEVKSSREKTDTVGLSIDAAYGSLARGNLGADRGEKEATSETYHRQAPLQAVSAAGTIDRGHGVYFKLRWTAKQILEGEKVFRITLAVPAAWRGSLIDVSVRAEAIESKFGGLDRKTVRLGAADFVVAVHREQDSQARQYAQQLARAERELVEAARTYAPRRDPVESLPSILRHVARKLDPDSEKPDRRWLARVLSGRADAHLDREIVKLPMKVRLAVLDYTDARDDFNRLELSDTGTVPLAHEREETLTASLPASS